MGYTRVKICGIMTPEDAAVAAQVGADAVGLNFFAGPRRITFEAAKDILAELPPFLSVVALLGGTEAAGYPGESGVRQEVVDFAVSSPASEIMPYVNYLQLYNRPMDMRHVLAATHSGRLVELNNYWPVVHVESQKDVAGLAAVLKHHEFSPAAILLDTASQTQAGGTGESFNWEWIREARAAGELEGLPPIILAGGLNPENVGEAIRVARPYAVDVSSGVEVPGQAGVKDASRMKAFVQAVRAAG